MGSRFEPSLLAYTLTGPPGGPVLVFVGGLGSVQAAWLQQVRHFQSRWRVLTYDHRGMGASPVVDEDATMFDYASDLVGLLDHLQVERACFVGLSFGGRVLQALALDWPERVEGLVLGSTSAGGASHLRGIEAAHDSLRRMAGLDERNWILHLAPALFGPAYLQRHPERVRALARWRVRHPPSAVGIARMWQAYDTFDVSQRLGSVRCPTLVVHGARDRLSPVANGEALAALIPGARLEVLPDSGHSPNAEVPVAFNRLVEAFVTEVQKVGTGAP